MEETPFENHALTFAPPRLCVIIIGKNLNKYYNDDNALFP